MKRAQIDANAKLVLVARNPKSGASDQGKVVDELCRELEKLGLAVEVFTEINELRAKVEAQYAESTRNELRAVVAAGGDGTVSLLVNQLPEQTPIAILPLGTENLLAKYLKLKPRPRLIAQTIADGHTVRIDAGRANGKLFLVMLSCGFDADVVYRLHSQRKGHISHWSYASPIWNAIRNYPYPDIRIVENGSSATKTGKWAFVFNVPRYAMNLPFVTDAEPADGQLDAITFRRGHLLTGLFYLTTVIFRLHRTLGTAQHSKMKKFRIESDMEIRFQVDGDPGGTLPVEVDVVADRVTLVVSKNWQG